MPADLGRVDLLNCSGSPSAGMPLPPDTIHESAFLGDLFTLQKLLEHEGTDVDEAARGGQTPLHLACAAGRENIVRFLLATAHSNPNAKSTIGSSPIHVGARNGHHRVVKLLLDVGVNPDARGANNSTPLMFACQKGHVDVVRLLLECGADPNLQDDAGRTVVDMTADLHCIHLIRRHIMRTFIRKSGGRRYRMDKEPKMVHLKGTPLGELSPVFETEDRMGSCTAEFATDIVSGERVALLKFSAELPHERYKYASRAVHRKYAGGFGMSKPPATLEPMPPADRLLVVEAWECTLAEHIDKSSGDHKRTIDQLPAREVKHIIWSTLRCLADLHSERLVHTAVSLQSIARSWDGRWRLVDLQFTRMEGEENDKLARALSEEEQSALERQAMSDMETLSTEEMKKLIEMRTYMEDSKKLPPIELMNSRVVGTPPEPNDRASQPADVWGAGALFAFLLAGSVPLRMLAGPRDRYERSLASWLVGKVRDVEAFDLCHRLLEFDPSARFTAAEALEHSFFRSYPKQTSTVLESALVSQPSGTIPSANNSNKSRRGIDMTSRHNAEPAGTTEGQPCNGESVMISVSAVHMPQSTRQPSVRSAYQAEHRPDEFEELLPQTAQELPATHAAAWREQTEAIVALVNSRRGHRRAVKLRKKLLATRAQDFDLLEVGDYSSPADADLVGSDTDDDSGASDSLDDDEDSDEEALASEGEDNINRDATDGEDSGVRDGTGQDVNSETQPSASKRIARQLATSNDDENAVHMHSIKLKGVKKKILYNFDMLEQTRQKRLEKESRMNYAMAMNMTTEAFDAWLHRKKIDSILELEDGQRETLLDELRANIDRRWQYRPDTYTVEKRQEQLRAEQSLNRLNKLIDLADELKVSTPRLFVVLPSKNATLVDEHNAQWLNRHRWNSLSFALHPMCEWGGGHFLESRHAYALTNPFKNLRDMSGVLEWGLEVMSAALDEMQEHIDPANQESFIVPMKALKREWEKNKHSDHPVDRSEEGNPRERKNDDPQSIADHTSDGEAILVPLMKRVLRTVRARAARGAKSGREAAVASRNVGTALSNLEAFLLNADPVGQFGGLCRCTPPAAHSTGGGHRGTKQRTVWLCSECADTAVREGGWSLELGRTPPWTAGGLLHVLQARPLDAPQFPFVPPKVTEIPMADSGPPRGASTDLAKLYAPKTDTLMARHLLRRQPEPTAAAADRIPEIEAVVANAPGVDDCCAFVREDTVGVPTIVVYASPLGADREAILLLCKVRLARRRKPAAVVLLPQMPWGLDENTVQQKQFPKPNPSDWVDEETQIAVANQLPADAHDILRVLGDPTIKVAAGNSSKKSSTCCVS